MYILKPWLKKYCEIKNLNFSEIRFFSIFYYLLIKFKNLKRSFLDTMFTQQKSYLMMDFVKMFMRLVFLIKNKNTCLKHLK